MKEKILHLSKQTIAYLTACLIWALFVISVFSTSYFDPNRMGEEHPLYRWDNPLWFILFLFVAGGILYFADKKIGLEKISSPVLLTVLLCYTIILGVYWVSASGACADADQKAVSLVASLTAQDHFLFFEPGKYMQIYPNQLGMVALLEILYRIIGGENYQIFQYINAVGNGVILAALYGITQITFQKKKITNLFLLICFGCCHLILYSTFVYGVTLGLAFALLAVYLELCFLKKKNWLVGLGSAVCISLSILIKNNYSIFLVAMVLLLIYKGIEQRRIHCFLLLLLLIFTWKGMEGALISSYENRSGMELESGMPKIMWIAMGMQEGSRGEGWYNAFNYDTFLETGCNAEESAEIAREAIGTSLEIFREDPVYAGRFYLRKFVSQWNEPTYASIWVNIYHEGEYSRLIQSFYDGKLNQIAVEYMNLYQSFLLLGVSLVCFKKRKSWREEELLLLLIVFGGFLFHMIWEAKSQYIMPYFILLLPYAAAGYEWIGEK